MTDTSILRKAGDFVFSLFNERLSKKMVYHTYKHTSEVVEECKASAKAHQLSDRDTEVLLLAAWLHDTGYVDTYLGHEEKSIEIARKFLEANFYPADQIKEIEGCILATRKDQKPETLLEKILVDADLAHIGLDTFFSTSELLRVEWEIFLDKTFSQREWEQFQLDFLNNHTFETEHARKRYSEQLMLNIEEQRNRVLKAEKKKKKKKKEKLDNFAQPKRGIETMFRNVYRMHINLSAIADNKANMMISVNSIILSIVITYTGAQTAQAGSDFLQHRSLMIPLLVLLLTNLSSLVCAIISAQPEVTSMLKKGNKKTLDAKPKRKVNVLFFGNFTKIPLQEFEDAMNGLLRNKDSLYNNMIMDIYYLGDVLTRKYQLLKFSYAIFMVGLVVTVLSFIVVFAVQRL